MIVCVCHRISDRDIAREARAGCPSFETLQEDLRVGTACGACLEHAEASFAEHAATGCLRAGAAAACAGARAGTAPITLVAPSQGGARLLGAMA